MRWILAALLLLLVQALAWRVPSSSWMPGQDRSLPEVVSLLQGRNATPQPVELVGRVVDASPVASGGVRLTVDAETVDGARVRGMINASLRETNRIWRTGDRVSLRSRLRRIAGFGNFGEMDYAAYCARRGILLSAGAWDADDAKALDAEDGAVDRMRRRFSSACEAVGGQGAQILEALTIGDRTGMDPATSDAVRDAGLAHFLAISGSHMALIVALVVGLVRRGAGLSTRLLQGYDVLRLAAVCGAVAVVAYGLVAGGGVSVARSVLMAVAAMVALWQGRPGDDLRALGGSAIVLALAMPGVGEEAGFQLSYLAVAALMLESRRQRALPDAPPSTRPSVPASPPTAPQGHRRQLVGLSHRALDLLREAAWLTVVCWIVTTPVVAHHFQRVSLVAPLANLLAAPLVSAVVVAGLLGLLLLPLAPWAGMACVHLGSLISAWILAIAKWCASLPLAATATPAPGPLLTLLLTGLALSLLLPTGSRRSRLAVGLAAGALVLVGWGLFERYRSDRLDVWFASVGQGDAAVVRLPGGQVWVVDAGPPGRGRMVVGPLLRRLWVGRIDVLVASHLQADHAGAAPELLQDFAVGEFLVPDGPCEASYARSLVKAAETAGVPVRRGSRAATANGAATTGMDSVPGDVAQGLAGGAPAPLALANAEVDVAAWWPPAGARPCNENNQSQVLAFSYAGRRIVFSGDVEKEAERAMLQASLPGSRRSDVLKVPHHGSRTSSSPELLDALRPALAVASVGLDNQWHFPAADVVARYEALGTRLLRTDRDGAVHLVVERSGAITVETFGGEAFPLLPSH